MKLEINKEQLELLKYAILWYECNDKEEERIVNQMSMKDLVQFVFDDYVGYYEKLPDVEFLDEAKEYWEDQFDDVVNEIKEEN